MKSILPILFVILSIFVLSNVAQAKVYRCDGMIRHRPCDQKVNNKHFRELTVDSSVGQFRSTARASMRAGFFSRISRPSFERVNTALGRWRGFVSGNGLVHLHMQIFRNKVLEATRYMGKIELSPKDREIPFRFESALPSGSDWSWKIFGAEKPNL